MPPVEFRVNQETCIRCGQCVRDCIVNIIKMDDYPQIHAEDRDKCIHCGHCQAVCPTASITLDGHASDTLAPVRPPLDEEALRNLVQRRRSIRHYAKDKVDEKLLDRIIRMISWAPTGSNKRGVSYMIFNGQEQVQWLRDGIVEVMKRHDIYPQLVAAAEAEEDRIFRGAPCVLLTHAPVQLLAMADCATAIATLELALPTFGLASCWTGYFVRACEYELPAGLSFPEGNRLYGGLMIGKPLVHYRRVPYRSEPRIEWIEKP